MTVFEAFFATFLKVRLLTRKFASFGHDNISYANSYSYLALYFVGRAVEIVIGYPAGLLAACFSAIFQAIVNHLFFKQKEYKSTSAGEMQEVTPPDSQPQLLAAQIALKALQHDQNKLKDEITTVMDQSITYIQGVEDTTKPIAPPQNTPKNSRGCSTFFRSTEDQDAHLKFIKQIAMDLIKKRAESRLIEMEKSIDYSEKIKELNRLFIEAKKTNNSLELLDYYNVYKQILVDLQPLIERKTERDIPDFKVENEVLPESPSVEVNGVVYLLPRDGLIVSTVTSDFESLYRAAVEAKSEENVVEVQPSVTITAR